MEGQVRKENFVEEPTTQAINCDLRAALASVTDRAVRGSVPDGSELSSSIIIICGQAY